MALKVFKIRRSGENDLMQFMTDVKPQIVQLVSENVNFTSREMHLVLTKQSFQSQQREKELNFSSITHGTGLQQYPTAQRFPDSSGHKTYGLDSI